MKALKQCNTISPFIMSWLIFFFCVLFSDQEKKSEEREEDKEEESSPKLPAGVPRMVGGLPGLGGVNIMAELKAKQEKRKSMVSIFVKSFRCITLTSTHFLCFTFYLILVYLTCFLYAQLKIL